MASVTEEIRSIRGCVLFAQEANDCRTILITSPNPQEGKTRTASDLAVALAEGGPARPPDRRRQPQTRSDRPI